MTPERAAHTPGPFRRAELRFEIGEAPGVCIINGIRYVPETRAAAADCRTCKHCRDNGPIASCASPIRCVDASRYAPGVAVRLWETRPADAGF